MIDDKSAQKFLKMSEKEFDKYMCETYPNIFRERTMPMNQTCMCWGFSIGKGWYAILDRLCDKLQVIEKVSGVAVIFTQIKEKFGGARYYYRLEYKKGKNINPIYYAIYADMIGALIHAAENKSDSTCAECGDCRFEMITIGSWVYDVCEKCFPKLFPDRVKLFEDRNKKRDIWTKLDSIYPYVNNKELRELVGFTKSVTKRMAADTKKRLERLDNTK